VASHEASPSTAAAPAANRPCGLRVRIGRPGQQLAVLRGEAVDGVSFGQSGKD